ncbi:MAG: hypothetical protein OJF49_004178 [Ktedonobacterales bacterium]|jgi:signal transduction histidine kinase|nr:MAG: hypothetical protein OJF49_004178 [Ktedonobacterales bacterium]
MTLEVWRTLQARWRTLWLTASPWRAFAEVAAIQAPVLLWVLIWQPHATLALQFRAAITLTVIIGPACILWCVFRMRRPALPWWLRLALYTLMGLAIGLTPSLLLTNLWQAEAQLGNGSHFPSPWFFCLWLAAFTCAFVVSRLGVRALTIWNGMRRRRLVWSLTHAHLVVVVLGAMLLVLLVILTDIFTTHTISPQLLPILFIFFILTVIALLVVLPPSALFSYLFARRTTRRLRSLTDATATLRDGDYSVRVPVVGEDEVAQLQADFNAMAADLERAVRELQAERDTVAKLLQARRELVASVSHELRTPVATLRSYLESTRIHWDDSPPPTLRHDLAVMEHETVHLQTLIDDLFTLSRAEIKRLELRCEPVDAGQIAQQVVEKMAPLAWRGSKVEIAAEVPDVLPLAHADASRLEQVLQNLLHNAVRHTAPGGIVAVVAEAEPACVALHVKDTGEGIAPEDLPRIFERFYRGESSRARPGTGSGLGLALVKELTEAMGGTVTVASTPSLGSCFTVHLPLATVTGPTIAPEEKPLTAGRA